MMTTTKRGVRGRRPLISTRRRWRRSIYGCSPRVSRWCRSSVTAGPKRGPRRASSNNTTAVPTKAPEQLALIAASKTFFTKNPSYQSPSTDVTPAKAAALITAATQAQKDLSDETMALKAAGDAWTLAYDPLADSANALIKNLEGKLDKLDPRWLGFGLQMPGTIATPGKPMGLVIHMDEDGNLIPQYDALPLSTHFRWRGFAVDVETEYRLLKSTTEPMASIAGFVP